MKKTAKIRFAIFIIIHIFLCIYAFVNIKGYAQMCRSDIAEKPSELYIDGTDFTGIAELGVAAFNGVFSLLGLTGCSVSALLISIILFVPMRIISLRKLSEVSISEIKATLIIIIAGTAAAFAAGVIFSGISMIIPALIITVPAFISEILIYWLGLKSKNVKDKN